MSETLQVGVDAMEARGQKATRARYNDLKDTLDMMALKIREGRNDAAVAGWAGDVLIAAGRPPQVSAQVQAILTAFRHQTVYTNDPVGSERIASAAATLCLRPGFCVRARDCDDGVVAVGSALMSIGIPVQIVAQEFGPDAQPHVLLVFLDEQGKWVYADPGGSPETSDPIRGLKVGTAFPADRETRVDPMDAIPSLGIKEWVPELIGFGRSHAAYLVGVGAAGTWVPVPSDVTKIELKTGDALRGSFDMRSANTTGLSTGHFLNTQLKTLFNNGNSAYWTTWEPGETLPSDWPSDDPRPLDEWHFRVLWNGSPVVIDFGPMITLTGLRLWWSPASTNKPTCNASETYDAILGKCIPTATPPDRGDGSATSTSVALWAGGVVVAGGLAYFLYRHHTRRGRR